MVKLSVGSSRPWFLMYSSIVFWSTSPTVPQKYPRPHICCPQYLFLSVGYSSCNIRDERPFRYCMIWLGDSVVGHDSNICTWSVPTLPFSIRMWFASHPCRSSSRSLKATSPFNTWYRYFVIHTKWYLISYTVWLPFRYSAIFITSPSVYHVCSLNGSPKGFTAWRRWFLPTVWKMNGIQEILYGKNIIWQILFLTARC